MVIVRNEHEIELTPEELEAAYYEQQHLFDIEDVKMELESFVDDDVEEEEFVAAARRILETPALLRNCAMQKRAIENEYTDCADPSWVVASVRAIREVLHGDTVDKYSHSD